MNVYDFTVKNNKGEKISLSHYKDKVLLIINTATKCGLTPQYDAIQALYKKYKDEGFEVLDFPCNQFMGQAPGDSKKIEEFCTINYGTTFPRFEKIDVNGKNANPLFVWLKGEKPEDKFDEDSKSFDKKIKLLKPFAKSEDIKWNFGKFLINKEGNVFERYSPGYDPENIEKDIKSLL